MPSIFPAFLCSVLIRCLIPGTCQNPCIIGKRLPSRPALLFSCVPRNHKIRGTFCCFEISIFLLFLLYLRFCCFCSLCYFCSLQLLLLTLSAGAAAVSSIFRLLELYWQNAAGCIQACGIPTHFICCFVMFLKFFYAINTCFMAYFQTNTCIFIFLLFLKETL